jgi:hypothetical protein
MRVPFFHILTRIFQGFFCFLNHSHSNWGKRELLMLFWFTFSWLLNTLNILNLHNYWPFVFLLRIVCSVHLLIILLDFFLFFTNNFYFI